MILASSLVEYCNVKSIPSYLSLLRNNNSNKYIFFVISLPQGSCARLCIRGFLKKKGFFPDGVAGTWLHLDI